MLNRTIKPIVIVLNSLILLLSPLFTTTKVHAQNIDPIAFVTIDNAVKSTMYLSNTVNLSGFTGSLTAAVTGGNNSQIVKNGVDSGTTTQVNPSDTLSLKTTSANADNTGITLTLTIDTNSYNWTVMTQNPSSLQPIQGVQSGYTDGKFDVDNFGAATYSIPISVASGTAGMQPNISLNYNSRGGNGYVGMGWSLSGLSTISRCAQNMAQDGVIHPVNFDGKDKFCIDGQRLIAISGTYGGDGTEYRTENDTFTKIISYGTSTDTVDTPVPISFTAWTKSGLMMTFGTPSPPGGSKWGPYDSRIVPSSKNNPMYWAVDKIQDTSGNYMTIDYSISTDPVEYMPSDINYTGNTTKGVKTYATVQFLYQDKPEHTNVYISGIQFMSTKRLISITNQVNRATVRQYKLVYQNDVATNNSQLTSIQECGSDASCFSPTTFQWNTITKNDFNFNGSGTGTWIGPAASVANTATGDFDGDGKSDLMSYKTNGLWSVCVSRYSPNPVSPGFFCSDWGGHSGGISNNVVGDFNGDGKTDMATFDTTVPTDTTKKRWIVKLSNGSNNFNAPGSGTWSSIGTAQTKVFPGDYNGDGKTDILTYSATNVWNVCLSTGSDFNCSQWSGHSGGSTNNFTGDFNGDGMTDIMGYLNSKWNVCLSMGTSFTCKDWFGMNSNQTNTMLADFNGDGKTDIGAWLGVGTNWNVCLSTGSNFQGYASPCGQTWTNGIGATPPNEVVGDFNGDGKADMAGYAGYSTWAVKLSDGSSSFSLNGSTTLWTGPAAVAQNTIAGDFNGDGKTDIATTATTDGTWKITTPGGAFPNLLSQVNNGQGVVTNISYKPLTDNSVYTKYSDAVFPQIDLQSSIYVVSSYTTPSSSGWTNEFDYKYEGGKTDLTGRGFLGFKVVRMRNVQARISNVTTFQQDFRYGGLPLKSQIILDNGTIIEDTTNTLGLTTLTPTRYFPFIQQSITKKNEIDGSLVSTTTSTNQYDNYGNLTQNITDYGSGFKTTTNNTYSNDPSLWLIGRLTQSSVTKEASGQTPITKTSQFTYDPTTGLLNSENIEPGDANLNLVKQYTRDAFGNIIQSTLSGPNVVSRTLSSVYDSQGRFEVQNTNALNQTISKTFDSLGNVLTQTDPNGLVTSWQYDGFGRKIMETKADNTQTQWGYRLCSTSCPAYAKYFVQVNSSGAPSVTKYYDIVDREVRTSKSTFNNQVQNIDTSFDAFGRVVLKSDPYLSGGLVLNTANTYDVLGRLLTSTAPGNRATTYTYQGLTTTVQNPANQTNITTKDLVGNTVQTKDNNNQLTQFTYNSYGNLIQTKDSANNTVSMSYDIMGNKTQLVDPDTGTTKYVYNAFGELVSQTDANNNTTTNTYDKLGRIIQSHRPEGDYSWTYDSKPFAVGSLVIATSPNSQVEYNFDGLGRKVETLTKVDGVNYSIYTTFDQFGRNDKLDYPSGLVLKNTYDAKGFLTEIRKASDNSLYWQLNSTNGSEQITTETFGNGLQTRYTYDTNTGLERNIATGVNSTDKSIQDLSYTYDDIGNVTTRKDGNQSNITETFTYDNLNRLISSQVGTQTAITQTYDNLGDITSKSDVGAYTYGGVNAKPHAVTSVAGTINSSFSYDNNGNELTGNGTNITYTSFNKPLVITKGNNSVTNTYGVGDAKIKDVAVNGSNTTTTIYIGGIYEKSTTGSTTKQINYISNGSRPIAITTIQGDGSQSTNYLHDDQVGSISAITDSNKAVVEKLSFDAWGNRRNADWSPGTNIVSSINKGFTGHQELDAVGLVDMQGRTYDPVVARFVSADPYIQAPDYSQSYNRYTYVLNNPLTLTDPTGYNWFSKLLITAAVIAVATVTAGAALVAAGYASTIGMGMGMLVGGTGIGGATMASIGLAAVVVAGAGFGFGSSFAGTLLSGGQFGDALKAGIRGGIIGGAQAAATFGVGSFFQEYTNLAGETLTAAKSVAHGVVGGLTSMVQGGKFSHGFYSAAASELLGSETEDLTSSSLGKVAISGVIGGTASVLGGGKFANGAVTGAFVRLFNENMHQDNSNITWPESANQAYYDPTMGTPVGYNDAIRGNNDYSDFNLDLNDSEYNVLKGFGSYLSSKLGDLGRGPIIDYQQGMNNFKNSPYAILDKMNKVNNGIFSQGIIRDYKVGGFNSTPLGVNVKSQELLY